MTLSLSIIKDLRSSSLIFTPNNLQFPKPQNLPQLLLILTCFSLEIKTTTYPLYDKRDAFGFQIVNFPFMSSNIRSAPAYAVYAFQLIRYARCCSNYSRDLTQMRTGGQRTAFEIRNCRNATIHSCYLLLSGPI